MEANRCQAIEFMTSYRERMKAIADRHRRDVRYQLSDRVLIDEAKPRLSDDQGRQRTLLDPKWWGPYTVIEVWVGNPNSVRIDFHPANSKSEHNVINVAHLRPADGDSACGIDDDFVRLLEQGPVGGGPLPPTDPSAPAAPGRALQLVLPAPSVEGSTICGPRQPSSKLQSELPPSEASRRDSVAPAPTWQPGPAWTSPPTSTSTCTSSSPLTARSAPPLPPISNSDSIVIELSSDDDTPEPPTAFPRTQAGTACIWRGGEM